MFNRPNNNKEEHRKSDSFGNTPLMIAIIDGKIDNLNALLKEGADVNATDSHGHTALMLAVIFERPEMVKTLLSMGANKHKIDNTGATALSLAQSTKNMDTLRALSPQDIVSHEKSEIVRTMLGVENRHTPQPDIEAVKQVSTDKSSTSESSDEGSTPILMEEVTTPHSEKVIADYISKRKAEPNYTSAVSEALSCIIDYARPKKLAAAEALETIVKKANTENQNIAKALREDKTGLEQKHGTQLHQGRLGDINKSLRLGK